jgi:hypothetical protein
MLLQYGKENILLTSGKNQAGFAKIAAELVEDGPENLPFIYSGINEWIDKYFCEYGMACRIDVGQDIPIREFIHVQPEYKNIGNDTCRIIFRAELLMTPYDTVEEVFDDLGGVKTAHFISFLVMLFDGFKKVHNVKKTVSEIRGEST